MPAPAPTRIELEHDATDPVFRWSAYVYLNGFFHKAVGGVTRKGTLRRARRVLRQDARRRQQREVIAIEG